MVQLIHDTIHGHFLFMDSIESLNNSRKNTLATYKLNSKWINWFTITVHFQVIFFVKDSIESPNNSIGPRKIVQLVTCANLRPYTFTNCSINSLPYSLKNCSIDLLYNSRSYTLLVNASIDTIINSHLQKRKKKTGGFEPCPCMRIV